jgi:tetratricopeptide (TPR) repeat protein
MLGPEVAMFIPPPAIQSQDLPREAHLRKQRDIWLNVARNSKHDMEAWHKVAEFELQLGNPEAAIEAETKAIGMFPRYAVAYATRARAHFDKRDFAAARADASRVIELLEAKGGFQKFIDFERPPEHYIASYRLRGLAYAWEQKWDPAFADLAAAVKLSPNDASLEVERAKLFEKAKRPKEAVPCRLRSSSWAPRRRPPRSRRSWPRRSRSRTCRTEGPQPPAWKPSSTFTTLTPIAATA